MSIGAELRNLGRYLDRCEQKGTVSHVSLNDGPGVLAADVTLDLSLAPTPDHGSAMALTNTTIDADGSLTLSLTSERGVLPEPPEDIQIDVTETAFAAGGTLTIQLSVAIGDVDSSSQSHPGAADDKSTAAKDSPASEERDIPPFRDTELLAEIYTDCETFEEMTQELGMDVTAETVRRYMIEHGIHEPASYDTESASDDTVTPSDGPDAGDEEGAQTKVVIADGIGLPDDVTVETLIDTVKRSNTIFEVKQDIGIERQDALDMLQELNLLDLVMGRLADESSKNITRDEIIDRLREASATA